MRHNNGRWPKAWRIAMVIALAVTATTIDSPRVDAQAGPDQPVVSIEFEPPPQPPPLPSDAEPNRANIINGVNVPEGALPFLAAVRLHGGQICGGTLISPQVVVSAAHCFSDDFGNLTAPTSAFSIGLGSSNLTTFEQIIGVQEIIIHPDYRDLGSTGLTPPGANADIALVVMSNAASLTGDVDVVDYLKTDPAAPYPGVDLIAAGWGDTIAGPVDSYPTTAQWTNVTSDLCSTSSRLLGVICGEGPGINGICFGDSGGPLLEVASDGGYVLVGITSQTQGDCGFVDFYTRISQFRPWLEEFYGPFTDTHGYVPVAPSRILDSRPGHPGQGRNNFSTPWSSGTIREVQVIGVGGVPSSGEISAVLAHVTSVAPSTNTYAVAWAAGMPNGQPPTISSKNFGTTASGSGSHTAVANDLVVLPVGADGTTLVSVPHGSTHLVIDVVGYLGRSVGYGFESLSPSRILDSRPGRPGQGSNNFSTPWGGGETRSIQVTNVGGVPATGVAAVAMQVTSVAPTANSYLTAWASSTAPTAASKNFGPNAGGSNGHTAVTNDLLIVPVSASGTVQFRNAAGSVHFVADVVGWFGAGATDGFRSVTPTRIVDSRPGHPGQGSNNFSTPWGTSARTIDVTGVGGVPTNATAVLAHVTSVAPTTNSFMTAWGDGGRPTAASKNYGPSGGGSGGHAAVTNDLLWLPVDSNGNVRIVNNAGQVHFVIDVVGYVS